MPSSRTVRVGLLGGRNRSYSVAEKLAARTVKQPNGCWEVQGSKLHSGHVQIASGSPASGNFIRVRAHVFAWEQANGRRVPDGLVVMHLCDQPNCVNPAHLQIGTQADNIRDSVEKGRFTRWHRTGVRLDGRRPKRLPLGQLEMAWPA